MTSSDKLLARFIRLPNDFTFDELERLLAKFGYERSNKGKTSGSRIIYKSKNNERPIMIHKPHPGNIIKSYAMKQILDYLKEIGYIKGDAK